MTEFWKFGSDQFANGECPIRRHADAEQLVEAL
jgi:hypothetical protein